jgi:hypothetical protein
MSLQFARRTLVLLSLLLLAFSVAGVGAQGADPLPLATALQNTTSASSLAYDFDLSVSIAGVPGAEQTPNVANISGTGALTSTGLDLSIDGSASMDGENLPFTLSLRIVDGVLYFSQDGRMWSGTNLDELMPLLEDVVVSSFRQGFAGGVTGPGNIASGDLNDPAVQESVAALNSLVAGLDLSPFTSLEQVAEDTGLPVAHYVSTVDLAGLMQSDDVLNLIMGLVQVGDPSMSGNLSQADLNAVGSMIGQVFNQSSFTLDYYVDTDTELLNRFILNLALTLDPTTVGSTTGQPIAFALTFDVNLHDYDSVADVIAPEGAMVMSNIAGMMGLDTPSVVDAPTQIALQATPTVTPAAPVTTSSTTIVGNTPTPVTLSAAGPTDLTYVGSAGETISVVARSLEESGTLDTTLEVLSPTGTRLNFNDDHGTDRANLAPFDSAIEDLVLPSAGNYTIRVTTFSGAGAGSVEVTVESDMAPVPQATVPPLGPNATATPEVRLTGESDTVTGEVPAGSTFTYTFNGRANQVTTITAIAGATGDLDPKVTLIGPTGQTLAENDDHTDSDPSLGSLDSRISGFVLPADGDYSVVVSGFANTSGAFTLSIERAVAGGEPIVTPVGPVSTPSLNSEEVTVNGQIRAGETYIHQLAANAGDVYTIVVRGQGDFDSRLIISNPDGLVVAENDDHNSDDRTLDTFDSKIENLILQESGTYTVEVTDYSGSAGSFDLVITRVLTGAPLGAGQDTVSLGEIEEGGTFTTTIDLNAGDFIGVTVRTVSGDLDPQVSLIDPQGRMVAENDDHADTDSTLARYDSRIPRMLVTETGTYTIEVSGYSGRGTFTVTINTLGS